MMFGNLSQQNLTKTAKTVQNKDTNLTFSNMAERREAGSQNSLSKTVLGMLAVVGLSTTACAKDAPTQPDQPQQVEFKLADASEAQAFATLSEAVQTAIRDEFKQCMEDVEEFAKDVSGGDEDVFEITYQDGTDDCDSIRESEIRSAKAKQNMDELTRSITAG